MLVIYFFIIYMADWFLCQKALLRIDFYIFRGEIKG